MVKIKLKTIIFGIILSLFLVSLAHAVGDKLSIQSIRVYVDGNKDSGKIDVVPLSVVKVKVKVENIYDKITDIRIEDITITGTIFGIDNDDDIEEESDSFDLKPQRSKSKTLIFKIPLEVEEEQFDLLIEVEGEDENGTTQRVTDELTIDVEKKSHELYFRTVALDNEKIKCGRSTSLRVSIVNIGTNDEEVELSITNDDLEISKMDSFELSENPFDDDSKFSNRYSITVGNDVEPGVYPIDIKAEFNDGEDVEEKSVELEVECEKKVEEEPEPIVQEPEEQEQEPIVIAEPITGFTTLEKEEPFFKKHGLTILIVLVEILIIIIALIFVIRAVRKR